MSTPVKWVTGEFTWRAGVFVLVRPKNRKTFAHKQNLLVNKNIIVLTSECFI